MNILAALRVPVILRVSKILWCFLLGKRCASNEFGCVKDDIVYKCIPRGWVCDLSRDCYEKTDEMNCKATELSKLSIKQMAAVLLPNCLTGNLTLQLLVK